VRVSPIVSDRIRSLEKILCKAWGFLWRFSEINRGYLSARLESEPPLVLVKHSIESAESLNIFFAVEWRKTNNLS
jgi:hypothetical protein